MNFIIFFIFAFVALFIIALFILISDDGSNIKSSNYEKHCKKVLTNSFYRKGTFDDFIKKYDELARQQFFYTHYLAEIDYPQIKEFYLSSCLLCSNISLYDIYFDDKNKNIGFMFCDEKEYEKFYIWFGKKFEEFIQENQKELKDTW